MMGASRASRVPMRPCFTALASTMCIIPSVDMRGVTLVSGGILQSRLDDGGGKQKSESGQTNGKLHNEWEGRKEK